jgi:hypothetical protein
LHRHDTGAGALRLGPIPAERRDLPDETAEAEVLLHQVVKRDEQFA